MTHILYKNKEKITQWLQKYNIQNYELIEDKEYGYIVNVNSNVDLCHNKLKQIKIKFNIINGTFDCRFNKLNSLYGCPKEIKGAFYCSYNKLESLQGCPEIINGAFWCNFNILKSLQGCSKIINEDFWFNNNQINSLEYFPEKVGSTCYLFNNPELGEVQNIEDFEELKKIHELIALNKKLEKEITLDNSTKNAKIKL